MRQGIPTRILLENHMASGQTTHVDSFMHSESLSVLDIAQLKLRFRSVLAATDPKRN